MDTSGCYAVVGKLLLKSNDVTSVTIERNQLPLTRYPFFPVKVPLQLLVTGTALLKAMK